MGFQKLHKFAEASFFFVAEVVADMAAEVGLAEVDVVIGVRRNGVGELGEAGSLGAARRKSPRAQEGGAAQRSRKAQLATP